MAKLFEDRKVDNILADGDADARLAVARLENSERKILQRKMRIRRDVDKRFERHVHADCRASVSDARRILFAGRRAIPTLQKSERAQIFARFVEAAAAERSHEFSPGLDAVGRDLPFAPGKKDVVEGK